MVRRGTDAAGHGAAEKEGITEMRNGHQEVAVPIIENSYRYVIARCG